MRFPLGILTLYRCNDIELLTALVLFGFFRELSPATKHALYSNFALYSPITDAGIELSSRVIIVMKIWLMFDCWASLFLVQKY